MPARTISLNEDPELVILYSDAACEPSKPATYGWVAFIPGSQSRSAHGRVSPEFSEHVVHRKSQICIGEMLGAPSAIWTLRAELRGKRVLLFVDNQAALAALIGGASAAEDTAAVACLFQLLLAQCGTMAWA